MGRKFARLDRFGRGRKSRPLEKLAVERSSGQRLVDEARVGSWFIASSVGVLKWFAIVGVRLDICASLLAWVGDSGGRVDAAERDVACVLTPSWSAQPFTRKTRDHFVSGDGQNVGREPLLALGSQERSLGAEILPCLAKRSGS